MLAATPQLLVLEEQAIYRGGCDGTDVAAKFNHNNLKFGFDANARCIHMDPVTAVDLTVLKCFEVQRPWLNKGLGVATATRDAFNCFQMLPSTQRPNLTLGQPFHVADVPRHLRLPHIYLRQQVQHLLQVLHTIPWRVPVPGWV